MTLRRNQFVGWCCLAAVFLAAPENPLTTGAVAAAGPPAVSITASNTQRVLKWTPFPSAQSYKLWRSPALGEAWIEETNGTRSGFQLITPGTNSSGFYRVEVQPLGSNALLSASILNRLAYGPTPDELERVASIGPQAFINEQLVPEAIPETFDTGLISTNGGAVWLYGSAVGTYSGNSLNIYLSGSGVAYLDDIRLVAGSDPEAGVNLISNGDFESGFPTANWIVGTNATASVATTESAKSGINSLKLDFNAAGSTSHNSIQFTNITGLTNNQVCSLGFWYRPATNRSLTIRLSGSGVQATPDTGIPGITFKLNNRAAAIGDLRAWHIQRAIRAKRQLLETQLQFWENHFVTQYSKSRDYFDRFYDDGNVMGWLATDLELRENQLWRSALLNPGTTFHDLLKISAESPAMIIFLDTVDSRGDGSNVANENYAREILELFAFGVDNGYDQNDIVQMSRIWSGWTVRIKDADKLNDPFAVQTTNQIVAGTGSTNTAVSNLFGVWGMAFRPERHFTNSTTTFTTAKSLFYNWTTNPVTRVLTRSTGKTIPARFGPPWAGRDYSWAAPVGNGTNAINEGYAVVAHLADQPFTQEFMSVKLCRLFVHDGFDIGYDFTDGATSPEEDLVKACMLTWENSLPKGNIRAVLATIFSSDLFRGNDGSMQKVRTPFEFGVAAVRSLRAIDLNGRPTADTDGYNIATLTGRAGAMGLFDRAEPDGFPEAGPPWISAGTLAERIRFAQDMLLSSGKEYTATTSDPVALIRKKLPLPSQTDAAAVVDYFLAILFPGEGAGNLESYRAQGINFLNTADDGVAASPFSALTTNNVNYDPRVRGMVAMLMTFPRFQEQ